MRNELTLPTGETAIIVGGDADRVYLRVPGKTRGTPRAVNKTELVARINVLGQPIRLSSGDVGEIVGIDANRLLVRVHGKTRGTPRVVNVEKVRVRFSKKNWSLKQYTRKAANTFTFTPFLMQSLSA